MSQGQLVNGVCVREKLIKIYRYVSVRVLTFNSTYFVTAINLVYLKFG